MVEELHNHNCPRIFVNSLLFLEMIKILISFFGIYKPNLCHIDFSSKLSIILSKGSKIDDESFFAKNPFLFSKFLIITLSPNFFF